MFRESFQTFFCFVCNITPNEVRILEHIEFEMTSNTSLSPTQYEITQNLELRNLNTERLPRSQIEDGPIFFNLEVNRHATTPIVTTPVLSANGTINVVNTVRTRRPRRTKAVLFIMIAATAS